MGPSSWAGSEPSLEAPRRGSWGPRWRKGFAPHRATHTAPVVAGVPLLPGRRGSKAGARPRRDWPPMMMRHCCSPDAVMPRGRPREGNRAAREGMSRDAQEEAQSLGASR